MPTLLFLSYAIVLLISDLAPHFLTRHLLITPTLIVLLYLSHTVTDARYRLTHHTARSSFLLDRDGAIVTLSPSCLSDPFTDWLITSAVLSHCSDLVPIGRYLRLPDMYYNTDIATSTCI